MFRNEQSGINERWKRFWEFIKFILSYGQGQAACKQQTCLKNFWMCVVKTITNITFLFASKACKTKFLIRSTLKSTSVSICFRGISRLPSAFVFLGWFKLAHISIQVCTFHDGCKQGIDQQIFDRKSIPRKITHPQSWKLKAKLTGEKLKGWSDTREKINSRLQSKFCNTSSEIIPSQQTDSRQQY